MSAGCSSGAYGSYRSYRSYSAAPVKGPCVAQTFDQLVKDLDSWMLSRAKAAAEALGASSDPRAVPLLVDALGDALSRAPDEWGRRARVEPILAALRRLSGVPAAIEPLVRAFSKGDVDARRVAAGALGETGDRSVLRAALEPLLRAVGDNDPEVRALAAEALAEAGDERAIGALVRALATQNVWGALQATRAQDAISQALTRLGRPLIGPVVWALGDVFQLGIGYWADKVAKELGPGASAGDSSDALADERALPVLIGSLAHGGLPSRSRVVEGWVRSAPASIEPLLRLARCNEEEARLWAAEALGRIGGESAVQALADMLRSQDTARAAAAIGLGLAGDARGLKELIGLLHGEMRPLAAEALGALGAQAAPALRMLQSMQWFDPTGACRKAVQRIKSALRDAPAELEAAPAPAGRGTELEAAGGEGRGTEPEAAEAPPWQPGR